MSSFISSDSSSTTEAMMPKLASYVVFSIDPVATLETLDDPKTKRAATKMRNKKYLGYVSKAISIFDDEARYQSYSIQLARRGMPPRTADDFLEPDMSVPILPATEHPLGRPPLSPSPPLPWSDCYQPSFNCETTVRVRFRYEDYSSASRLSLDEMFRHRKIMREDDERRYALVMADRVLHPPVLAPHLGSDSDSVSPSVRHYSGDDTILEEDCEPVFHDPSSIGLSLASTSLTPVEASSIPVPVPIFCPTPQGKITTKEGVLSGDLSGTVSVHRPESISDDNMSEDGDDIAEFFAAMIEMTRPPDNMVVVEVSYDLASISSPADPEEFFKELAYLKQLEKESKERAIARARKIDEKAFNTRKNLGTKILFQTTDAFIHAHRRLINVLPKFRLSGFLLLKSGKPRQHDFAFRRGQEVVS